MGNPLRFLRNNGKTVAQLVLGVLSILVGLYFIKQERSELVQVRSIIAKVDLGLLAIGLALALFFVVVQGWMYQFSFRAVQRKMPLKTAMLLYLKRNFVSVFIPAGTVTNMFFFNKDIERDQGIPKSHSYYASTIFSLCSIASSVLIAIPAVVLLLIKTGLKGDLVWGIVIAAALVGLLVFLATSLYREGWVFVQLQRWAPELAKAVQGLHQYPLERKQVVRVLLLSCVIELIGVAHLYLAMMALHVPPSLTVALIGYALVLVILMTSPFLRGIGAIEAALTYALTLFGLGTVSALTVAFLFRFFEFWSILVLGLGALLFKRDGLLLQLLAPVLLFLLGVVNILSGLTPALAARVRVLRDFIPYDVMALSNTSVILVGVVLVVTSVALVRGFRNSYYVALFLALFSCVGHVIKGIDWEEASLALVVAGVLVFQRKEYFIRSSLGDPPKWAWAMAVAITVLCYGVGGFYVMDARHFNMDFNLWESLVATIESLALMDTPMKAATPFGQYFVVSLHILGVLTLGFLLWTAFQALKGNEMADQAQFTVAKQMVAAFGHSPMDYFKTYPDKQLYFLEKGNGFVSYKMTKRYAVALEDPVCRGGTETQLGDAIMEFEAFARSKNRKTLFYRIPWSSKGLYEHLGMKTLLIGEEARVDLRGFSLEGGATKDIRNAINKMHKAGYVFQVNPPPQPDGLLQKLAHVSREWLEDMAYSELCFSQGIFSTLELKEQTLLTVENTEGKIVAFLNIIPSVPGEGNFDLMRKTADAPNGTMDFLFANMLLHVKELGFQNVNLGMVPLSGIDGKGKLPEQVLRLAYNHIRQFGHYKSLHAFKDKFHPVWEKVYLAYGDDLDLVNLPTVLNKVMKVNVQTI
ncbi:phosphatidylglycerol lysyltransferase domain-containing protein [Flagellimonas beolgyonensis]|uniref:phosphatidylglycerol lysyltransferase domain-containing protein n=1 Tax=Flagellimonas beolgyonensis TaxID=864064 RepID=UPI003D65F81E